MVPLKNGCKIHCHYYSNQCNKTFSSRPHLKRDISGVHSKEKMPCNSCSKEFTQKDNLIRHISTIHEKLSYPCELCGKELLGKAALKKHMEGAHLGRKFTCNLCDEVFSWRHLLSKHIKNVHNEGKRKIHEILSCNKCDKTFHTPSGLREHVEITHYERKFSCDIYNISVASVSSMEQHVLIHQEKSDISNDCINCEKKFKCKKVLKLHIKKYHKNLHYNQA